MLDKTFDPKNIESKAYKAWEEGCYFKPQAEPNAPSYSIVLPPPNVTGSLHMGHGFQHTIMDALTRYHRMRGVNTLWQPGTDHAGIATQMVVERQLVAQGLNRHMLGREAFIERVWEWKKLSGDTINQQMKRLGSSADWSRNCFTMDEKLSSAVRDVFIKLYEEGLIYRGKRLVNWDIKFHTAISDLEVISTEEKGKLYHIRYPLSSGKGHIVVATTRPETMLGDEAVAVHPEDERFKNLVGQTIHLPLANRTIPIIADDYVDPEFGTGAVKITPAHDFNDYAMGQRHHLPLRNIFTTDAHLNENAPKEYQGLERFKAREKIMADLSQLGLVEKIEEHVLKVPRGDRSGEIIEPYLTDQWFVKANILAKPALEAVAAGKIRFIPENWTKTYNQWLENIEDWCISRQLWWGHRIPAWYDDKGNIYVGKNESTVREKYRLDSSIRLTQDEDVLDTWFSSALWPFSTLGWPENTFELKTFYPTSVLVTGFDIIFFWVARMVMFGLHFVGDVPFKEVYITGLIRDAEGQKMSKSKGNVLDPIDLIDGIDLESLIKKRTFGLMQPEMTERITATTRKEFPEGIPAFGADALRFTFCALATNGRDIRFDTGRINGYRNFCNKIWNAGRYVIMNTENHPVRATDSKEFSLADKWIWSRLQNLIQQCHHYFESYRFDLLAQSIYDFIWYEYCDWYLELSKPILLDADFSEELKAGTRYTLINVLETTLCLLHPIMPFITEEIWQSIASLANKTGKTIMLEPYPLIMSHWHNTEVESELEWLKQIILAIRNIRGEMNIPPKKALPIYLCKGNEEEKSRFNEHKPFLMKLAILEAIHWLSEKEALPATATALVGQMEIHIPLEGLIDTSAEIQRLEKEIEKWQKELNRVEQKLGNSQFVQNAPTAVLEKEQARKQECEATLSQLTIQLKKLKQH